MSNAVFEGIMAGLEDAKSIIDGTADPATYRVHEPVDVRAIRNRLGLSQEAFAQEFALAIGTLRDWEQGRKAPDTAARNFLIVIDKAPDVVRQALQVGDASVRV